MVVFYFEWYVDHRDLHVLTHSFPTRRWSYVSPSLHILPFIGGRLFGSLPERGDIVIVKPPGLRSDFIKRVIGLPGDTVVVEGGRVWLNGRRLQRSEQPLSVWPVPPNMPMAGQRSAHYLLVAPCG